ncbi:hypothetical protein CGZ75_18515 [Paenibacillus herberti]|uniref:Uncharacterized protein n=1 Tax=Paenibacillus herberti TaxID=1619309 RepID=A0A229NYA4_9BACL|nr:hypothetical protein CGZ75_18515 [Paenibacillus herberti]
MIFSCKTFEYQAIIATSNAGNKGCGNIFLRICKGKLAFRGHEEEDERTGTFLQLEASAWKKGKK